MRTIFSNLISATSIAWLLVIVTAMLLFNIEDPYQITLLFITLGLITLKPHPISRWSAIDYGLVGITLWEILSCSYARCPIPAISSAFYFVYLLTLYFLCRRLFTSERSWKIVSLGSYVPIAIALLLTLCSFFIFRNSVLHVGFSDTYHFRFLFKPLGYITNVWSEVLLVLLGWICLVRRYSTLFRFLCLVAILLSFSRGAYVALGIYLVGYLLLMPKVEKLKLLLPALSAVLLVSLICPKELQTTLEMNKTASQQQSTASRIQGTTASWEVLKERPLLGYGSKNYTYALDAHLGQDSTKPFTSFAPNTVVQLLIEKGILGTLLYLLVGLSILRQLWRRRDTDDSRIIGCTLIALLAKDMSQSALLETPFLLFMVCLFLAYLQREEQEPGPENSRTAYLIPILSCIALLSWNLPILKNLADPTREYLAQKDYLAAYQRHPEDIQVRFLYALHLPESQQDEQVQILQELATGYPKNSLYLSSYAESCYQQGDTASALQMMTEAIRYTPRLLNGERMQQWQQQDTLFYAQLQQSVRHLCPTPDATPADYARYGYIAYQQGEQPLATTYLRRAVESLPNLATPWHLLGDDAKYRLLLYGAFHNDLLNTKLPEQEPLTQQTLLEMSYSPKLSSWYGVEKD